MSIQDRLSAVQPTRSNRGCQTCDWLQNLNDADRAAFEDWLEKGWSMRQLHYICSTDPDDPLQVSLTALRNHIQSCS